MVSRLALMVALGLSTVAPAWGQTRPFKAGSGARQGLLRSAGPADHARAARLLGRRLSSGQKVALTRAHHVGVGELGADGRRRASIGNYTAGQKLGKVRILKAAGFSRRERRALMRSGIVGLGDFLAKRIGAIDPTTGNRVRVVRKRVDDWGSTVEVIQDKTPRGWVTRRHPSGTGYATVKGSYRSAR